MLDHIEGRVYIHPNVAILGFTQLGASFSCEPYHLHCQSKGRGG